jgi:hypothetical protein
MATLEVELKTGGDDLRGNCWANLIVKIVGLNPIRFDHFVSGLGGGSSVTRSFDIPELNDPNQIEFFQIEHISQEGFLETRDNWNLDSVTFTLRVGRFPLRVGEHGPHRFAGNSPTLTIYPPPL